MAEIISMLVLIASVVAVLALARPSMVTRIGPNTWIGIRTRETLKSRPAWDAAHHAAWPYLRLFSVLALVILVAALVLLVSDVVSEPDWIRVSVILALVVWTAGVIYSGVVANRAAQSVDW